ncbi:Glycosyltransferase, catalytic subunit of cellulose synthase and poly-beta-1,6-N-acetylglucosamine synthase [Evansella caseinilytica]|uniref:Glycosyltransferase, catalytic subunit of cellulose synthase and poly-beta-1,6-N-acetylglucosamine synthase n=1 Tax=Evansella caseinilytica TaxID=1503961 RepID=A0A1H3UMQ2_9BACI|nr:glycosyltransferase family 2 protein [Evansella caseinilytica]SDZ63713.1 Glycosyltransferase, catalytic subunit of cellulose synthase and poly-beta-1,6-N-acetylglucosamine synthase [Evansella caseinilytica]
MMNVITNLITYLPYFFAWFLLIYMGLVVLVYTGMLLLSIVQLKKEQRLNKQEVYDDYLELTYTKPVSILVPAYNEEAGIIETVRSLLSLKYPQTEIVVINDGSKDQTLNVMIEHFQMVKIGKVVRKQIETEPIKAVYQSTIFPHLLLVDKSNGGKADALNAGLNISKYPYFCSIDGDSILETDALLKVMKPIVTSGDEREVIASGGNVRIANGSDIQMGSVLSIRLAKNPLVVMQVIEYLRAFLMGRIGLSRYNMVLIISGAFSVFAKKWVIEAGGYSTNTVGEDMELVVRLHRLVKDRKLKKRVTFVADPVCWTEAPESLTYLQRQRSRWHRGLLESLWLHRGMTFNPKYGTVGTVAFPYFWMIELFGPVIEFMGYLYIVFALFFGGIYLEFAIALFLLFVLYGSVFSMTAVVLEGWSLKRYPKISDVVRLMIFSLFEAVWYRPLTVLWRCGAIIQTLFRSQAWGEMTRKGLAKTGQRAS